MLSLVITVVVIIVLALVAFANSTRMIDEADYSKYTNNVSEVESFFEKTSVNMHGSDLLKDAPKRDEQIYNYVAKGGSGEADFLHITALPGYTVIKENADIGIDLPVTKVESGTGHVIPIKYATTKDGQIFTWPPYEYGDELYITKTDTVGHKMQTEITVGGEKVQIKIDPTDGSLMDADVEQKPLPNNPIVPEQPDVPENPEGGTDEEHDFSGKIQSDEYLASAATCVSPAKYYYKCLQCSAKSTETYAVGGGLGHIYGDWKTNGTATCISTAEKTKTCTRCGDTQRETIAKNPDNHTGGETTTTVVATCTKEGSKTYKCASCGVQKRKETIAKDPSNHGTHEQKEVVVDATCTIAGSKTYTCSGCSAEISTETIPALSHSFGGWSITTPATCTTTGVKTRTCSRCGSVETATLSKDTSNHHNGDVNTSTTDATCTVAGKVVKTCTLCGGTLSSETIAALGHIDENKDNKCDRCGTIITYDANTLVFKADGTAYLYGANGAVTTKYTGWMDTTYSSFIKTPWYNKRTSISAVVFEDGVNPTDTASWFYGYSNLKSVTIGEDMTTLGSSMFYGCTGLEELYFNAKNMGDFTSNYVFYRAGRSTDGVVMRVGKNVTRIPNYFIGGNSSSSTSGGVTTKSNANVLSLTFETGSVCTYIGAHAFAYNENLSSIILPSSVVDIGAYAFADCTAATKIVIPEATKTIGDDAFDECTRVKEVEFNAISMNDLESMNGVFSEIGYSSGGADLYIGENVTKIPAYVFKPYNNASSSGHAKIKSITFRGNKVKSIGTCAFYYFTQVTSVTIPNSVTTLGGGVFTGFEGLTTITIPKNVTAITSGALFSACKNLKEININATRLADFTTSYGGMLSGAGSASGGITVNFGANVTKVPAYMFYEGATYLKAVNFAEGSKCTSIGDGAFRATNAITEFVIPENVTYIGEYAFRGCSQITSLTIPAKVTQLGECALNGCTGLTELIFDDPYDWHVNRFSFSTTSTVVDLSNKTNNVTIFLEEYTSYYCWQKT